MGIVVRGRGWLRIVVRGRGLLGIVVRGRGWLRIVVRGRGWLGIVMGLEGARAFHFRAVSFLKAPLGWVRSEAPKGPTGEHTP